MLGAVITDSSWKQACLPRNKTGIGIRQEVDQLKEAYLRSSSQSDALVEQITGEKITQPNLQQNSGRTEQSRNYAIYKRRDLGRT